MPTPWPRPWPKCSPWPPCSMIARASDSRSGGDDRRDARRVGPEPAHAQLDLERDIALASPDECAVEHRPHCLIGELARSAQALDLAGVLDRAQLLDRRGAGHELPPLRE